MVFLILNNLINFEINYIILYYLKKYDMMYVGGYFLYNELQNMYNDFDNFKIRMNKRKKMVICKY